MKLSYHPEAENELIDAFRYYEERSGRLGERFLSEFDEAITKISTAPERWAVFEDDLRIYSMRRFPFAIYYLTEDDKLLILVVKHHSRRQVYWRDRLKT